MSDLPQDIQRTRLYHHAVTNGNTPSLKETLKEWFYAINFLKHKEAIGASTWLAHYLFSATVGIILLLSNFKLSSLLYITGFLLLMAQFFHTFWYHRYCSHKAFKFRAKAIPFIIQWLNPLLIKEEIYVLPHYIHHKLSDKPEDPYGPHLGPTASFLASESQHYFNRNMRERTFKQCQKLLNHIPSMWSSQSQFQATGSFEKIWLYPLRLILVNFFWICFFVYVIKSPQMLGAWYISVFLSITILRDFNYRGHDEEIEPEGKIDKKSLAVNSWFYGYFASEWHDNHHRFSSSARCGFKRFELDLSFLITVLLKKIGLIENYIDSSSSFARENSRLRSQPTKTSASGSSK
ncbi:MAG: fatty acid desaturase [Verrucomicrobiota bacterium]